MTFVRKWANYDVAHSRLLMQISELDSLIDQEQAASTPNPTKIAVLENEQNDLIDQSDMLCSDNIELTSRIATTSPSTTGI